MQEKLLHKTYVLVQSLSGSLFRMLFPTDLLVNRPTFDIFLFIYR